MYKDFYKFGIKVISAHCSSRLYLSQHKPLNYLAEDNLRPPVLALSSRQAKIKLSTAARRS